MSRLALALAALLWLALASPALGEDEVTYLSMESLSEEDVTYVSTTGTEILAEIRSARAALAGSGAIEARRHVAKARAALGRMRAVSPSTRIQDRIADTLGFGPQRPEQLLPIYAELDEVDDEEVFIETRRHVDAAKAHLAAGRSEEAAVALTEASATLRYLEIDLPVEATYDRLGHALMALNTKQPQRADAFLKEAEENVQSFLEIASASVVEADVAAGPE